MKNFLKFDANEYDRKGIISSFLHSLTIPNPRFNNYMGVPTCGFYNPEKEMYELLDYTNTIV